MALPPRLHLRWPLQSNSAGPAPFRRSKPRSPTCSPIRSRFTADAQSFNRIRKVRRMHTVNYLQAVNEALSEEMTRDERVFYMGEDVSWNLLGATGGLVEKFGKE